MKRVMLAVFAVMFGLMVTISDASARRMGGGRSFGMQRAPVTQSYRQAKPAQAPAAAPAPGVRPQAAPAQSGWRRWAGPLAGLAAGIGLAALLSHLGVGGNFAGILLLVLVAGVAFMVIRRLLSRPAPQREAMAYANQAPYSAPVTPIRPAASSGFGETASNGASIPAGFDIEAFTRSAKVNFIRLQAAHDAGNLDDIREFTSPEMFAELKLDIDARAGKTDKTDVVSLEAELIDVTEEANRHIASVRFHGLLREEANAAPTPFDEVWHLAKPATGSQGWVLAGIEQMQ